MGLADIIVNNPRGSHAKSARKRRRPVPPPPPSVSPDTYLAQSGSSAAPPSYTPSYRSTPATGLTTPDTVLSTRQALRPSLIGPLQDPEDQTRLSSLDSRSRRPKPRLKRPSYPGLDSEQAKVLNTILRVGVKQGATRKELKSAVQTGLVESTLRELDYGDADSQNWRQERSGIYGDDWARTGGPLNTRASAKRYFQEAAGFNAPGKTAGQIAADTQRPLESLRGRYQEENAVVKPLLQTFLKAQDKGVLPRVGGQSGPSPKALRKWIVPTESRSEIAGELGLPKKKAGAWRNRLDPDLQQALVNLGKATGEPVRVNEGFRTRYRQEELASGRGGATGPAAAPGTSNHEHGDAADLDLTAEQRSRLGEFGLGLPVPGEDWHVELLDDPTPGGSGTLAGGGGSSFPLATGGAAPSTSTSTSAPQTPARRPAPLRGANIDPLVAVLSNGAAMPRSPLSRNAQEGEEELFDLLGLDDEEEKDERFRPRRRR